MEPSDNRLLSLVGKVTIGIHARDKSLQLSQLCPALIGSDGNLTPGGHAGFGPFIIPHVTL